MEGAYERVSIGKGAERHADGQPFEQQDICTELRLFGLSPAIYQIRKKAKELLRFNRRTKQIEELQDIIVYAAAAIIVCKEGFNDVTDLGGAGKGTGLV